MPAAGFTYRLWVVQGSHATFEGDFVPEDGVVIVRLALEIEVDVNEAYIGRVSAGQKVEAVLDAYPDAVLPAHVIATIPTASRDKATVRVRIALDSKDPRILPDMAIKVTFQETRG